MTKEVLAVLLVWFIIINLTTYFLFRLSHQRVNIRLPALPGKLLSGFAVVGGAPAAYVGFRLHSNTRRGIMPASVAALLAVVQLGLLAAFIIDLLVMDIF